MADRQRGVQIHRGIIYGSHARLLSDAEKQLAPPGHTHRWSVFLTSAASPPPKAGEAEDMDYIPGGADDLSYMLKKVTIRLHETYPNPSRVMDRPPYIVTETGWGEFTVGIRIQFVPEANEKPITLSHPIKLHHWGAPIEPPAVVPGAPATASAAPTPAASATAETTPGPAAEGSTEKKAEEGDVKMEVDTPAPASTDATQTTEREGTSQPGNESEEIVAIRPDPPGSETAAAADPTPAATTSGPLSIAARYPVHAWQYDELIFYDPPLLFYNILNDHPPTPLPARNRRARDQRDQHDQSQKKKKGRASAVAASSSRANTPLRGEVSGSVPPATTVPGAGEGVGVGIPGEPGSADVPLEFTTEMEKGEWNRLHEARKHIIDEMDRWRLKLIEEEKELQKLKDEMAAMAATPVAV